MMPLPTVGCGDVAAVQFFGNSIVAVALGLEFQDQRPHGFPELCGLGAPGGSALREAGKGVGLPSRVPFALAAASAALVRCEIISRSCSATAARMWCQFACDNVPGLYSQYAPPLCGQCVPEFCGQSVPVRW